MSLSGSNGTLYVWAGHSLEEVLPQVHKETSWSSMTVTFDL